MQIDLKNTSQSVVPSTLLSVRFTTRIDLYAYPAESQLKVLGMEQIFAIVLLPAGDGNADIERYASRT